MQYRRGNADGAVVHEAAGDHVDARGFGLGVSEMAEGRLFAVPKANAALFVWVTTVGRACSVEDIADLGPDAPDWEGGN